MLFEPSHRPLDPRPPARVIVEDELLERTRLELAIRGEPHRDRRKAVRLLGRVEAERIRLRLRHPAHRVRDRSQQVHHHREDRERERKSGGIGEVIDGPARPVPPLEPAESMIDDAVADAESERDTGAQPEAVVQPVVPHLVAHDGTDLGQRGAVQQVVVQRDARRAAEAGDVRADALGLLRGVEPEDVVHRHLRRAREREDRVANFARRQRPVVVEERLDEDGMDGEHEQDENGGGARRPPQPALAHAAHEGIYPCDREAEHGDADGGGERPFAEEAD